jgi:hypothetical protein
VLKHSKLLQCNYLAVVASDLLQQAYANDHQHALIVFELYSAYRGSVGVTARDSVAIYFGFLYGAQQW